MSSGSDPHKDGWRKHVRLEDLLIDVRYISALNHGQKLRQMGVGFKWAEVRFELGDYGLT